jgi:hypothetical protein
MKLRRIARSLAALSTSLFVACGGGGDSPGMVVATRIDELGQIFGRASIALSRPADIEIEYRASGLAQWSA